MEFNFKKWNNLFGLGIFIVAAIVYLLTIERYLSFWDCGEYIVSSAKLGITHAPGAALFQLIGAVWSGLAFGDGGKYAVLINAESAICSAITIMLLFWTITHFAKRMITNNVNNDKSEDFPNVPLTLSQGIIVIGSGLVGASIFMFSDTFWFSAEEGEVYAMASLFTAIILWLGVKWENDSEHPRANRWLILISLVIGLATGVHLMVILAVPAVCYMYYARKYKFTIKNFIIANIVTIIILAIVFKFIFHFIMTLYGEAEIFAVNSLGLPFNSGTFVATLLIGLFFWAALHYTKKYDWKLLNTIALSFLFMIIGFSCWLVIPIRANANPHMNLNDPDTALGMKDYYNRVQYGDWPVMHGPTYVAHIADDGVAVDETGNYKQIIKGAYYKKDERSGKYLKIADRKDYVYNDKYVGVFPKMFDSKPEVMENYAAMYGFPEFSLNTMYFNDPNYSAEENAYARQNAEKVYGELIRKKQSGEIRIKDLSKYSEMLNIEKPTLGQQINYFMDFQVGYMFLRYFMWNFSGRQNDWEGHKEVTRGNWITGVGFIDNARLGDQSNLPAEYKDNNMGHNNYYMLPLILGLIGFFFQLNRNFTYWWTVLSLFFLTSIGIIIYTSVKPFEPRERDYALVSSFYAFAIWCGLGVQGIYFLVKMITKKEVKTATAFGIGIITLGVPLLMGFQNWDDHDRSERKAAYSLAHNYLNGLDKNSILFVYGDNDTYPVWGLLETENFRDDVKVVNYTLAGSPWNISQVQRKTYNAEAVPNSMKYNQYHLGVNDNVIVVHDNIKRYFGELKSLFTHDPTAEVNLAELMQLPADELSRRFVDPQINPNQVIQIYNQIKPLEKYLTKDSMTAKEAMEFILDNNHPDKLAIKEIVPYPLGPVNFLPVSKIIVPVNKENALKHGILREDNVDKAVDYLTLKLNRSIHKNELMMLDMFAHYNWDRAIYFSGGGISDPSNIFYTSDYLEYNGFTYKLVPIYEKFGSNGRLGTSNVNVLYSNFNNYLWGNYNSPTASFTETDRNYTNSYRNIAVRLAEDLIAAGRKKEAIAVLDTVMEKIPAWPQYDLGYGVSRVAGLYIQLGETKKGQDLLQLCKDYVQTKIDYYNSLEPKHRITVGSDFRSAKSDVTMILYNEISSLNKAGDKQKALSMFNDKYLPLKKELVQNLAKYSSDQEMTPEEEESIYVQFQNVNELLSMAAEIDSAYAQRESNELFALVGQDDEEYTD